MPHNQPGYLANTYIGTSVQRFKSFIAEEDLPSKTGYMRRVFRTGKNTYRDLNSTGPPNWDKQDA